MTPRVTSSVRVQDVNLPDDGPQYEPGENHPDAAPIKPATMRHMHGLLRMHGHTERDDVLDVISAVIGHPITSRAELTEGDGQRIVAAYEEAPLPPSPPPGTGIYAALAAVMRDVDHVAKGDRNTQQNFSFRGVDAVVNASGPAFRKHKVIVLPVLRNVEYQGMPLASGKTASVCRVVVAYQFYAPDGSSVEAVVAAEAFDMGDKATPKAMSVAFRTALLQSLALPTDEPDPDSQTFEAGPAPVPEREKWRPPVPDAPHTNAVPATDDLSDLGTADLLLIVGDYADSSDLTFYDFTAKWRKELGDLSVDALDDLPPETVTAYVRRVRHHLAQTGAQG